MNERPAFLQGLSHDEEPIAALASGSGMAAIAIVRLSGLYCHELLQPLLRFKGSPVCSPKVLRVCSLVDPASCPAGTVIDAPMVVFFQGPQSYTGQDSAELHLHGGPYIVQKTLALLWRSGFRPAEPGEFSRRAYLAGKMDLTEAEGIHSLIAACSEQQWLAARQLASGLLRERIEGLRTLLLEAMAWLEAGIDFPDEGDTAAVDLAAVDAKVALVQKAIEALCSSYDSGRVASQGLSVALFGQPNAGKSTLLNALLGTERALVSPIAGTTRDYLEESCLVKGRLIRLIDTAGVHATDSELEQLGIERSLRLAKEADLVLFLLPADGPSETLTLLRSWLELLQPRAYALVLTKADLPTPAWYAALGSEHPFVALSCATHTGLQELQGLLAAKVDEHIAPLQEGAFITTARHKQALELASEALERFAVGRRHGAYEEMLAFELQDLAKQLGSIIGQVESDEVLGVVFSSFCVGK